jgi:S1-C subfamily serine protease
VAGAATTNRSSVHRLTSAPPPKRSEPGAALPGDAQSEGSQVGKSPDPKPRSPARSAVAGIGFAALGAGIAVAALASAGVLDGNSTTTIIREPVDLALAEDRSPPPPAPPPGGSSNDVAAAQRPLPLPKLVAGAAPSVVKVNPSGDERRLGSGFVIDAEGRILTNSHVLDDEESAAVTFSDGSDATAAVLGKDDSTDLAVLEVDELPAGTRPARLGTSGGLEVGSGVVAIGNPFGLERTATTGIVSAIERVINAPNSFRIQNVIQTDAAINRGNSGGPLLDLWGRVVGINSQIATSGGGNVGIGFAIPIDTIVPVAESLIETGVAEHAWIGITGRSLTRENARDLRVPGARGVAIVELDERGSARAAGLRAAPGESDGMIEPGGDVIVAAGGAPVADMADVTRAIAMKRVGEAVELQLLREGRRVQVSVPLIDRPEDVGLNRP